MLGEFDFESDDSWWSVGASVAPCPNDSGPPLPGPPIPGVRHSRGPPNPNPNPNTNPNPNARPREWRTPGMGGRYRPNAIPPYNVQA